MDFTFDIGWLGVIVLAVGALTIAIGTQLIGEVKFDAEWALVGLAALAGGFIASEWIVGWRAFQPVFEGLALIPALIGGLVGGVLMDALTRYFTHGTYLGHTA